MSAQVDYRDGCDAVSGEPISLVPVLDPPPHFTDCRSDDRPARAHGCVVDAEDRFERHRAAKLNAAIGVMRALIVDAESGDGLAASRLVQAASADLIIPLLGEQLKRAKDLIPGHVDNEPARHRIEAALAAAGIA